MHRNMNRIRRRNFHWDPDRHFHGNFYRNSNGNLVGTGDFDANGHFDFYFANLANGDLVDYGDFAVDCAFWTATGTLGTTWGYGDRTAAGSGTGFVSGFGFGVADLLSERLACWNCMR